MTCTVPLRMARPSAGQTLLVPQMATGKTGTWFITAIRNAPSLNSPTDPSTEIFPSGKISTECPAASDSDTDLMITRRLGDSRSTSIIPTFRMRPPEHGDLEQLLSWPGCAATAAAP